MSIVTKSPLTGTVTDSHHGGWSAARLRWAGFDGLVFKGKAAKPVYAYVHDGVVELLDASEVWGKGTHDTIKFFKAKYGEKDLSVIAIGQAGEHLVKFACWMNENDRASGRGGTGCVGGSKNLKAVVIKAEKKLVKAADRDSWKTALRRRCAERHHGRRECHQPAQGRPVGLWHQRADEHHQQHRRAAHQEQHS